MAFDFIKEQINNATSNGDIKEVDANSLFVNIIGLCVFPFVGKPILKVVLFDDNEKDYADFLEKRKTEVTELIINSIKK